LRVEWVRWIEKVYVHVQLAAILDEKHLKYIESTLSS
jgi:hypothetical protein